MASPLTWREVSGPDFRGVTDALRLSGASLQQGISNLTTGLTDFQKGREEQAQNAALNAAQGYSDPMKLREAIANGSLFNGVNRGLLTADAFKAINGQAGTLLTQAAGQEDLNFARQMHPKQLTEADLINARRTEDNRFQVQTNPTRAGILTNQLQTGQEALRNTVFENRLSNERGTLDQEWFRLGHGDRVDTRQIGLDAERIASEVRQKAPDDRTAWSIIDRIEDPRVRAAAIRLLPEYKGFDGPDRGKGTDISGGAPLPALTDPVESNRAALSPAAAALRQSSAIPTVSINLAGLPPETQKYVPAIRGRAGEITGTNAEKARQLAPFVAGQESGNRQFDANGKLITSSAGARGLMQLMPATAREIERELGMKPGETDTDIKANARAGEHYLSKLLDKYDGNVELTLAAYNAGPGRIDGWLKLGGQQAVPKPGPARGSQEERQALTQGAASRSTEARQILDSVTRRAAQNTQGLIEDWGNLRNAENNIGKAVEDLSTNNLYKDLPPERVINTIQSIQKRASEISPSSRVTAQQVAALMKRNPYAYGSFIRAITDKPNIVPDYSAIDADLKLITDPHGADAAWFNTQEMKRTGESFTAMEAQVGEAEQTYLQLQQRATDSGRASDQQQADRALARLQQAQAMYRATADRLGSSQETNSLENSALLRKQEEERLRAAELAARPQIVGTTAGRNSEGVRVPGPGGNQSREPEVMQLLQDQSEAMPEDEYVRQISEDWRRSRGRDPNEAFAQPGPNLRSWSDSAQQRRIRARLEALERLRQGN